MFTILYHVAESIFNISPWPSSFCVSMSRCAASARFPRPSWWKRRGTQKSPQFSMVLSQGFALISQFFKRSLKSLKMSKVSISGMWSILDRYLIVIFTRLPTHGHATQFSLRARGRFIQEIPQPHHITRTSLELLSSRLSLWPSVSISFPTPKCCVICKVKCSVVHSVWPVCLCQSMFILWQGFIRAPLQVSRMFGGSTISLYPYQVSALIRPLERTNTFFLYDLPFYTTSNCPVWTESEQTCIILIFEMSATCSHLAATFFFKIVCRRLLAAMHQQLPAPIET